MVEALNTLLREAYHLNMSSEIKTLVVGDKLADKIEKEIGAKSGNFTTLNYQSDYGVIEIRRG
jgi:hypothetical protein